MGDAKEIKAKIVVEYDGSGVDKAKEDLSSLADIVGGQLAESTGNASDGLAGLDEQMGKSAESTRALTSSVGSLEKPLSSSGEAVTSVTEALGAQQAIIGDTSSAYEALQKPIETATTLMESASSPMMAISEHAQAMTENLGTVSDGFTQIGESLTQSVPLLPQFAENLHSVSEQFDPKQFGLQDFTENMGVFQDALSNPAPFSMIQQHLKETGQTWDDFSSSIGDDNTAVLHDMATGAGQTSTVMGEMSKQAQSMGTVFTESMGQTEAFTKQFSSLGEAVASVNKGMNEFGGVGGGLYGPEVPASMSGGGGPSGGFMETLGAAGGGITDFLSRAMMPLMAVQMIGMAVQQVGTAIYDSAAIAEGPGAHGFGTFTGTVDAIGQAAQHTSSQFAEAFGQGVLPALNAVNSQMNSGTNSANAFGKGVGMAVGILGDLAMLPIDPEGAFQGLVNYGAQMVGVQQPFQGPGPQGAGATNYAQIQQQIAQIPVQLAVGTAMMQAQASDPGYLAAQAYLGSQTFRAQQAQASYGISHYGGTTGPGDPNNNIFAQQLNPRGYGAPGTYYDPNAAFFNSLPGGPDVYSSGYGGGFSNQQTSNVGMFGGGGGNFLSNMGNSIGNWWNNLFGGGGGMEPTSNVQATWAGSGGCFPAGTQVLMSNGSTRPIEAIEIGERVLAHDGNKRVVTTVLATIKPLPRRVYALTFLNGKTLTLTDSHPIMTEQGWKSLNPEETKKENPDLVVTALLPVDIIHTASGVCGLMSIEPGEVVQIYNISVGNPHTFYANNILVHNKIGADIMTQVANTSIPQMSLKGSNLIDSLASNFSGASMEHTFTATVNWAATGLSQNYTAAVSWAAQGLTQAYTAAVSWASQGLTQAYTAAVSWASQGLSQAYTAVANWTAQNLEKPLVAVAQWAAQGLSQAYTAVASWAAQGLSQAYTAVASWASQGLEHTFQGAADWIGQNLTHTFEGIANWVGQNLNMNFSSGGQTPGFMGGVENFGGGWAVTGEGGPELVYLPQGASVYPHSQGLTPLSIGDNSGGGMITVNVTHIIQLDSRTIAQETIPHIASMARATSGRRQ